ncbi:hypothetical protein Droror1_Dr00000133 [Drosera rotundifolia]
MVRVVRVLWLTRGVEATRGGFLVHYYPDALEFLESGLLLGFDGGLAEGEVRELLWEKRAAAEGEVEALGVREKLWERGRSNRGGKECNGLGEEVRGGNGGTRRNSKDLYQIDGCDELSILPICLLGGGGGDGGVGGGDWVREKEKKRFG